MEIFAIRRHLHRHLNAECLSPLDNLIVQKLKYKSISKDFLLAEPPTVNDFYFLSASKTATKKFQRLSIFQPKFE